MILESNLDTAIEIAATRRTRLVVLAGGDLKMQAFRWDMLNLNKLLSSALMDIPRSQRSRELPELLQSLVDVHEPSVVVLSNIEILFDRSLAVDPIRLLKICARQKTLVVKWPSEHSSNVLSYGLPSHPEYRVFKSSDLADVVLCNAAVL